MSSRRLKKIILALGDLACLHLALWLTLVIRYPQQSPTTQWFNHWLYFWPVFGAVLLFLYINDLYNINLVALSRRFLNRLLGGLSGTGLVAIIYFYLNNDSNISPKTSLLIFLFTFGILFILWRGLGRLLSERLPKNNLAIIGDNSRSAKLLMELSKHPGAGYQITFILKSITEIDLLKKIITDKKIQTIVICDNFNDDPRLRRALFDCLDSPILLFNYSDFYENLSGKIALESINQSWFLENAQGGGKNYFNFIKQAYDWLLALLIFIISLPLWPLIAIFIKLNSRGPVFFQQVRLGKNGKNFNIIKFRSMRINNNDSAPTTANDERITKIGSFLRKTRLDELPQIINILRNEMSFIGPRPERPEIASALEQAIPFYKTRLLIKPGLTGWDQISGQYHSPSTTDTLEKLQHDLFYLKNRSLYLDFTIALKTLATIISHGGR